MVNPIDRLKTLNTRECLWIYVLRILSDQPKHAYALRKEIEERFGFRPGRMTAYKVLYLLHKKGFVVKMRAGRRVLYSITPNGKEALKEAVSFYKGLARILSK
ncbi:MAG: helix-turn-helix transcriptional regulator [Candidatus Aenigmarchaeota archaeon]|nr:helix-turn-helix transcriptional regulator [Candidatus Aenigmarchaeota archaeon]